jgi:hypothetical protein
MLMGYDIEREAGAAMHAGGENGLFVIGIVAFAASALTFFSGFGLGTLLLPAFWRIRGNRFQRCASR